MAARLSGGLWRLLPRVSASTSGSSSATSPRVLAAASGLSVHRFPLWTPVSARSLSARSFESPMIEEIEFRKVYAALVLDEPGVLSRISGMFSARGFNIDSLVVGRTHMSHLSRMTVVATGSEHQLEMIRKELQALVQVVEVVELQPDTYVQCDLLLVKLSTRGIDTAPESEPTGGIVASTRRQIMELASLFDGQVVDVSEEEIMVQLSGIPERIDQFVRMVRPYGITELHRTGTIALGKCGVVDHATMISHDDGMKAKATKPKMRLDPSRLPPS